MSDSSAVNQAARVVGALSRLLAAGCAGVERAQPREPSPPAIQAAPIVVARGCCATGGPRCC